MKKIICIVLVLCMVFALAACGSTPAPAPAPAADPTPAEDVTPVEDTTPDAAEAEYKLGMGVVVSTGSSKTNNAQVDATVATVIVDENGVIVSCRIDCAQSKMDVTEGAVDAEKQFLTKMELGEDYGMLAFSDAIAEWDAQTKAFEEFVVGKTADEVGALETKLENGHNVAVDETLFAGCTMDIVAFQEAVVKACNDAGAQSFTAAEGFTLGVAAITNAEDSTAVTDEADAVVKMYTEFGATVVDANGVILAAITDAIQPQITADKAGEITGATFKGTKRELGPDYGMVAYGAAIAEWDAQAQAFADFTVGMTAAEVSALETKVENGHNVSVDETLYASCTMDISGMMAVIAQAVAYAR